MHLIHGTIATSNVAQQIIPVAVVPDRILAFQQFMVQNNGSNKMKVGDASITSTQGITVWPSIASNPGILAVFPSLQFSGDQSEFNILGTAGDTYDVLVLD
jgi:hypothetical protein